VALRPALSRAKAAHGEHEKRTAQKDANWPDWYAQSHRQRASQSAAAALMSAHYRLQPRKNLPALGASGHIQIANTWLIVNVGGGPTPDKPAVTLSPLADPDKISSFMNIRVANIQSCYELWKSRGAEFITAPIPKYGEIRCYIRDPDGYIIEVGRVSDSFWSVNHGPLAGWARVAAGVSRIFAVPSILIGCRSRAFPPWIAIWTSRAWLGGTDAAD
jgi:hypothetical protein